MSKFDLPDGSEYSDQKVTLGLRINALETKKNEQDRKVLDDMKNLRLYSEKIIKLKKDSNANSTDIEVLKEEVEACEYRIKESLDKIAKFDAELQSLRSIFNSET